MQVLNHGQAPLSKAYLSKRHHNEFAGLMRTYMSDPISNPDFLNGCAKDPAFKRMLFGLAFFHSIVQVR